MASGGNIVACATGILTSTPACIVDSGCSAPSAGIQHTSGAVVSTNCPTTMKDGDTCKALCADKAMAVGTIKCASGSLVDASHCLSAGLIAVNVSKVVGALSLEVLGKPTEASVTKALAEALNVAPEYVTVFLQIDAAGRRLALRQTSPDRRLASKVNIKYEVAIPPNVSQNAITSAAASLSQQNSTAGEAFTKSMSSLGLEVSKVVDTFPPVVVQSVVVKDQSGSVVNDRNSPEVQAPAPAPEGSNVNAGLIIGVVLAGIAFLLVVGGIVRYVVLMRRKAEA